MRLLGGSVNAGRGTLNVPSDPRFPGLVAAAVLAALGILVYANSLAVPFIFDDEVAILQNPSIRKLWPIWETFAAPARRVLAGRPLVSLTFALNYAVGGLDVRGYHAVNLALHVLSALTLYGVVRRTLARPALAARFGRAAAPLALAVAAIWLVHPLQTEAVTYVTQRTELLMGLFYLLTLYAALRAWDAARGAWWQAAAVGCCALGMASKEVAVTAPLMVVVYDRVFVCASFREAWARRRGLYLGLAATWGVLAALLVVYPRTETIGLGQGITPWEYARTQLGVIVRYLGLTVWPAPLCLDYGEWVAAPGTAAVVLPGMIVAALLAGTAWALWHARPVGFLGAWFFLVLAPTSSVVPIVTEIMAERRMYLPLAAVVVLVVVGGYAGCARRGIGRGAGTAAVIALAAALGYVSVRRNQVYTTELSILTDTVRKRPDNPRVQNNLGSVLLDMGRLEEAHPHLAEAVRLEPRFANAHYNLGTALLNEGRVDEAIAQYVETLRLEPGHVLAHINLGSALLDEGRFDEAGAHFAEALRLDPGSAPAHNNLGIVLRDQGKLDEAIAQFAEAVRLAPDSAQMQVNLRETQAARGGGTGP